jgi:hypothetical protein
VAVVWQHYFEGPINYRTLSHNSMRLAKYEILEDRQYYDEIPGFQEVWAQAENLETCRDELQSALEDWSILGLRMGHKLFAV